jgi:hypothetical protein
LRILFTSFILLFSAGAVNAQYFISGTVFDNSKKNYVEAAKVISTGGLFSITDSVGHYNILVHDTDSIYFTYNNKPTQKFAVSKITNQGQFDISLRVAVESRFSYLKEVIVYSKTYKQDSVENRKEYADVFDRSKPGLSSSITPDGAVGADLDQLINIFRFRRNQRLKAFKARLEDQEQEKYINFRFNRLFVQRITGLAGKDLDSFMVWYRPSYDFLSMSSELQFNQYILNASYQYRKLVGAAAAKLPD